MTQRQPQSSSDTAEPICAAASAAPPDVTPNTLPAAPPSSPPSDPPSLAEPLLASLPASRSSAEPPPASPSSAAPPAAPSAAPPADHGWVRRVALLLVGQTMSLLGSSIVQYAIFWHLVLQSDSGVVMTMAMVVAAVPQAIVALFGGIWADRWNRKLLIMLPDALIALVTIGLAASFAFGWADMSLILVALAVRSAGGGIQTPAVQSFVPQITPSDRLLRVNSINGTVQSVNMIASPAIAAVLINVLPLWSILLVDVTTALIGIGFVAMIRTEGVAAGADAGMPDVDANRAETSRLDADAADADGPRSVDASVDAGAGALDAGVPGADAGRAMTGRRGALRAAVASIWADLRDGFAYAWGRPRIRSVMLGYAIISFVNVAPMNLTLLMMSRGFEGQRLDLGFATFDTAADKLAANELAWSLGLVIGGAALSALGGRRLRNTMRLIAFGIIGMGVFVAGLGVAPTLLAYLIVDFLVGLCTSLEGSPTFTLLQEETDEAMQGRVFGLLSAFASFGVPLGMLVVGPLADVIAVQSIFIVGGLLTVPVGLWLLWCSRRAAVPSDLRPVG